MEVLFVSNIVGNGGAGRVMSLIANYFSSKNMKVTICSYLDSYETYQLNPQIKNIIIGSKGKFRPIGKLKRIFKLRNIIKNHPDATVIAFEDFVNMQTIIASFFLKNKVIISERNDPKQLDKKRLKKIARSILYRFSEKLVCQTPEAKGYFNPGIQKKTVVIPNPILSDLPKMYEGQRKKEIVNFCRMEPQKNLKLLIDAYSLLLREYDDFKLVLYGDGSEKEKLIRYTEQMGLTGKVLFHNACMDVHRKVYDCAMFVSSSDYEGISNSMLEAMSMGLPVIATDCPCGGARMFIENYKNGILVPAGDKQALYEAMKYLIEHPKEAGEMARAALNVKKMLAVEKICKAWESLL
ncbi:MAG: Glycosyltransferase involved in cell wall biosynthesis [Lachnoclostridium sp.]|jgi:GalNAc-alpha-(1->4)-GalNAc-alpha-(1->3)-diNAcBac-PP-undecaprenol alpha-1,4-N-acetyl-D-galactosaminyltransferase